MTFLNFLIIHQEREIDLPWLVRDEEQKASAMQTQLIYGVE